MLSIVAVTLAGIVAWGAPTAFAAKAAVSSFGGQGTEGGQFTSLIKGLAVNQSGNGGATAGDIYVSDTVANRIQQFTAEGEFIRTFGVGVGGAGVDICNVAATCKPGTVSGAAGGMNRPQNLAIDQASGVVYVADQNNKRVDVFSAVGDFQGAFGWEVKVTGSAPELQFCTTATGCQEGESGSGPGQFSLSLDPGVEKNSGLVAVAVSPVNGHIFTADSQNRRISEFAPTLVGGVVTGVSFVRGYGWGAKTGADEFQICTTTCHAPGPIGSGVGQFTEEAPRSLAVDSTGNVYAADPGPTAHANNRIQAFGPEGAPLGVFAASAMAGKVPEYITIDPSSGHFFVSRGGEGGAKVDELDGAGNLLETYFPEGSIGRAPLATGPGERVYTSSSTKVYRLGTIVPPTAEIVDVETPSGTSAVVKAKINPTGLEGSYRIEFSTDGGSTWSVRSTGTFPADESDHEVSGTIQGLVGLTTYQVRVVAEKVFGSGKAEDSESFATPAAPPEVSETVYSGTSDTCVDLFGAINPENQATTYEFEYVSEAQFAQSGFGQASKAPIGGATLAAGGAPVFVAQRICGLTPRTTYFARLSARNATGLSTGAETFFTTFATAGTGLPDGRAYEQVSPIDKNGTNIQAGVGVHQAATDGNGVTFFTNAGLPGGEGAQHFPIYVALRNANGSGWATQGLLPPASTGPRGGVSGWTDDLAHAYSSAWAPGAPTSLYDRSTASGLIEKVATGSAASDAPIAFAGASKGGSIVMFEDTTQIVPKAIAGKSNVYLSNRQTGATVLAGVLNNGNAPAESTFAGPYDWFKERKTTVGGAAQRYATYEEHALAEDGSAVYFTAAGTGQLYVRLNPLQPQSAVDGGGNCTEPAKACTVLVSRSRRAIPGPEEPAAFMAATPDGGKALLTSTAALTEDANTGPSNAGRDLYLYDARTDALTDLTPLSGGNGAEVAGLVGHSSDLSFIYFVANGVLAPGASPGNCGTNPLEGACNLYVWHAGTISYITTLGGKNLVGGEAEADPRNWAPTALGLSEQNAVRAARVTPDGQTLLFRSKRQQTAYDNDRANELYLYRFGTPGLLCVSCNPTGAAPSGEANISNIPPLFTTPEFQLPPITRNLSANGRRVFFDTDEKLVSSDTNGVNDVYEWEAQGEGTCTSALQNGGCLYLISTGTSPRPSYLLDASANGSDVFFVTIQPLVAQDRDKIVDVYDARISGGIPGQNQVEPTPCVGESACADQPPAPPATSQPATPGFVGPGNIKPPRCKKGFKLTVKKGKAKCVKVKKHKKKHNKRKHKRGSQKAKHQSHPHRNGGK